MYRSHKIDETVHFYRDNELLVTPMGSPVITRNDVLATRLIQDLNKYGDEPSDPISLVAFHYAMIDFFSVMPREELERSIIIGLTRENDWTFTCPTADPDVYMEWVGIFGNQENRSQQVENWIKTLTLTQLCAVCVIGRALESVNIPFVVVNIKEKKLKSFVKWIDKFYPYIGEKDLLIYFSNYLFYFNIEGSI